MLPENIFNPIFSSFLNNVINCVSTFRCPLFSQVASSDSHTLTLRSVSRDLSGVFRCEVSEDAPTFHTEIKEARMQVVELPMDEPNLHVDKKEVAITDGFKAVCTVGKSYPSANLTWTINGKKVRYAESVQCTVLPLYFLFVTRKESKKKIIIRFIVQDIKVSERMMF